MLERYRNKIKTSNNKGTTTLLFLPIKFDEHERLANTNYGYILIKVDYQNLTHRNICREGMELDR